MKNKTLILALAVLAIGLYIMPSTLALFAGQREFQRVDAVDCAKCHRAEAMELTASDMGTGRMTATTARIHATQTCASCHRVGGVATGGPGNWTTDVGLLNHTISTRTCTDAACHPGQVTNMTRTTEPHREFFASAGAATVFTYIDNRSAACISCHTRTAIDITWVRRTNMTLHASMVNDTYTWTAPTGLNITRTTAGGY